MSTEKGVSIIEIIFAIGVTVLVITGTVSLLVKSTSIKTSSLQRKNASEMAEMVVENLINEKNNNEIVFWNLSTISDGTIPQFKNYTYDVSYNQVVKGTCSGLGTSATCVDAVINIGWGNSQTLTVKRFLSK